ncbi:uncharacterized protein [Rutidosis leptorrhynchoides]|uniref:uncharacterized protein n=1 Tax=Rutidosis leptorrhynchoides TaxID=125765 RepID=UPI003A99F2BB
MKNRLPTRVELVKRGINIESSLCPLCGIANETVEHTLLACSHASSVWEGIFKWWDPNAKYILGPNNIFRGSSLMGSPNHSTNHSTKIWQAIEWVTGYFIWKNRNTKLFTNDNWATPKIINEIQTKSFEWIKNCSNMVQIEWHQWLLHPNNLNFPLLNTRDPDQ